MIWPEGRPPLHGYHSLPAPPPAFRKLVWAELDAAVTRACAILKAPVTPRLLRHANRPRGYKKRRGRPGCCVECGQPRDTRTEGCACCKARHHMRACSVVRSQP